MEEKKRVYSTLDIVKALGIPRECLRDWMNRGFTKPAIPANGQGTKAIFDLVHIYGIGVFLMLIRPGFTREMAAKCADKFIELQKENKDRYPNYLVYQTNGGEVTVSEYDGGKLTLSEYDSENSVRDDIFDLNGKPGIVLCVNFKGIKQSVDNALAKL
jgi:hypothetical protein